MIWRGRPGTADWSVAAARKNAAVATVVAPNTRRDAFLIGFIAGYQAASGPLTQAGFETQTPNAGTSLFVACDRNYFMHLWLDQWLNLGLRGGAMICGVVCAASAHSAEATTPQLVLACTRP